MTLLTIAKGLAINMSLSVPTAVVSNETDENLRTILFTEEAGEELARRVDWAALRSTTTITGTGANDSFSLPAGFSRLIDGNAIKSGSTPVRVGLSADEWASLTPVVGTPRYAYLTGSTISFFPYLALAATVTVTYQSRNWCPNGTTWGSDGEEALVPEKLIQKGAIWRWRRHMGQPFDDHLAEYEATLADTAKFDGGVRSP